MDELKQREVHLIDHFPDFLKDNEEFNAVCNALDPEFNLYLQRVFSALNNIIPETADSKGLASYEEWLGILTNPYLSLDERKAQIIAKLNETFPFTEIKLQKMLAAIVGWGHFKYTREGAFVKVELDETAIDASKTIYDLLKRILPMNLYYLTDNKANVDEQVIEIGIRTSTTKEIETQTTNFEQLAKAYKCVGTSRFTKTIEVPLTI